MSKLNALISLNAYADSASTNAPSLNHFKWTREVGGISVDNPQSLEYTLAPDETKSVFSGQRILTQDNTTEYDLFLKPGASNTYILAHALGALPNFRTSRNIGGGVDTVVEITISATIATITYQSGTVFDFSAVVAGDEIVLRDAFLAGNQGVFKVLSKTATSISFENVAAVAEVVALGALNQVEAQSSAGVQKGDKLEISEGFSAASYNTYEITAVYHDYVEFYSSKPLASEYEILSEVNIYSSAKRIVYAESVSKAKLIINGADTITLTPISGAHGTSPGMLFLTQNIYNLQIENPGIDSIVIYIASAE